MCEKNKARCKEYYRRNKEKQKAAIKARVQLVRDKFLDYLQEHPCVDCGESDPVVLEFDHISDDKAYNISRLLSGYSWDKVLVEMNKCEVVCCNCHRRRTSQRNGSYRLARA